MKLIIPCRTLYYYYYYHFLMFPVVTIVVHGHSYILYHPFPIPIVCLSFYFSLKRIECCCLPRKFLRQKMGKSTGKNLRIHSLWCKKVPRRFEKIYGSTFSRRFGLQIYGKNISRRFAKLLLDYLLICYYYNVQ